MASSTAQRLSNNLWHYTQGQNALSVYALVDAAIDESIYPKIVGARVKKESLFRGAKALELAWFAPYLVQLTREDPFTQWFLEKGWGKSLGIFIKTPLGFKELKRHLQTILTVYDESGQSLIFRYYDPRVLRVYLPTCTSQELETMFGQVSYFIMEARESSKMLQFHKTGEDLKMETISLD